MKRFILSVVVLAAAVALLPAVSEAQCFGGRGFNQQVFVNRGFSQRQVFVNRGFGFNQGFQRQVIVNRGFGRQTFLFFRGPGFNQGFGRQVIVNRAFRPVIVSPFGFNGR